MKKNVEKTRSKVSRVFSQARESLKLLETLEKETIAKARTFVRNPLPANRLAKLKSLGVATRSEVEALEFKIERLEKEIAVLHAAFAQSGSKRTKASAKITHASGEAFPNT